MASISADDIYLMFVSIISWVNSLWSILRSLEIGGLNWLEFSIVILILSLITGTIRYIIMRGIDSLISSHVSGYLRNRGYYATDRMAEERAQKSKHDRTISKRRINNTPIPDRQSPKIEYQRLQHERERAIKVKKDKNISRRRRI